jgi:glycosyltransferase involved in cell wall biosynthesis
VTRILIIMPALNEEESLPSTLKELREIVDDPDILVIDDGSTDATAEVASRAGAVSAQLPFTLGVGGAVRVGLHYAQRNGYDRVVVIDADGQHDPAGITSLLEALDHGADMAVGSRFAAGTDDYPVGRTRRQAMRFLGAIVRALTGQRFSDVTSGFRAFDRPVIELLAREYPVEYLADTVEALLIVRYAGFRVDEVPISMRPRAAGVPSTRRTKLVINYLRLLIGILGSASRRARLRKDEA